jgi:hypothetical protein
MHGRQGVVGIAVMRHGWARQIEVRKMSRQDSSWRAFLFLIIQLTYNLLALKVALFKSIIYALN